MNRSDRDWWGARGVRKGVIWREVEEQLWSPLWREEGEKVVINSLLILSPLSPPPFFKWRERAEKSYPTVTRNKKCESGKMGKWYALTHTHTLAVLSWHLHLLMLLLEVEVESLMWKISEVTQKREMGSNSGGLYRSLPNFSLTHAHTRTHCGEFLYKVLKFERFGVEKLR